jgi:hypothetical protein
VLAVRSTSPSVLYISQPCVVKGCPCLFYDYIDRRSIGEFDQYTSSMTFAVMRRAIIVLAWSTSSGEIDANIIT